MEFRVLVFRSQWPSGLRHTDGLLAGLWPMAFDRSSTEIGDLNPTRASDICSRVSTVVSCVEIDIAMGRYPTGGIMRNVQIPKGFTVAEVAPELKQDTETNP
jgi:hypothetical protein